MKKIPHFRWWIAVLLALATGLSYLDRQSFPVAVTEIQKHIPLSDQSYSELQILFLLAYGIMYAGGGKLADWLGSRLGYSLVILWWSAATILTGLAGSVFGLGVARLLLGLGEGGGFPCTSKAISEWFPAKDRALAFGIFLTGSSVGAVVAPPLIAAIILTLNWRWVFFITGTLGFAWALAWWLLYDLPAVHKFVTASERSHIRQSLGCAAQLDVDGAQMYISWTGLFRFSQTWALIAAKLLTDSSWFFFIFWLPKYLGDVRHLDIKHIGYYAWIPYAFAGVGSFSGGWLSGFLIRRKLTTGASRKICMGISAAMMPISLFISSAPLGMAIAFFSMALFGHQFWSTILQTLATDIFPSAVVGSIAGLMGAIGSFGAMLFNVIIGRTLAHYHSYSPIFAMAGLIYPFALLVILFMIPRVEPVSSKTLALNLT